MNPEDVPAGPLAIDTDVFSYVHLSSGRHTDFTPLIDGHPWALPFAVIAELKSLGYKTGSRWGPTRTQRLNDHIARCTPVPADARVVERWAELYARFKGRLSGGGVNDLWVAACCLVHHLPLATNNLGDFGAVAEEFPLHLIHPDL